MSKINNRKQFLATVAATGAALALARRETLATEAQPGASPAQPSASPASVSSEKPAEKPPSAAALAIAAGMRRFDPALSDAEVLEIAKNIDRNGQSGAALNPKKKRLKNSDQPVTVFSVALR